MNEYPYVVLFIVDEIPVGKVASYSQIAKISGFPNRARMVGQILSRAEYWGCFPCHRVVHNDGSLVKEWKEQKQMLIEEGVFFLKNGKIDMSQCRWQKV